MAIYRLSAQIIGRAAGRSVTAAAAYRAGDCITDERTGKTFDYRHRRGVVRQEIFLPPRTPDWMGNRVALWNAVEQVERRRDAQLAREIQLALPHELDPDERWTLVQKFVRREFVRLGMIADVAVHDAHRAGDARNAHAHVLLTMRELVGEAFGQKARQWNQTGFLETWRTAWERDVNAALERKGIAARVDHRTLEAQRVDAEQAAAEAHRAGHMEQAAIAAAAAVRLAREPEPKVGAAANALERRGVATERGEALHQTLRRNGVRGEAHAALREIQQSIIELTGRLTSRVSAQRAVLAQIGQRLARIGERIFADRRFQKDAVRSAADMQADIDRTREVGRATVDSAFSREEKAALLGEERGQVQEITEQDRRSLLGEARQPARGRPALDRDRDD